MADLVIITGASRGLGLGLARTVPFPATVVDISRSGAGVPEVEHFPADLSDPGQWDRVGTFITELIDRHDPSRCVMIHNAGMLEPLGHAGDVPDEAYTRNVILNSAAGQVLGHYFLRAVTGREGRFDLVMISSGAATSVYPGWSSYGAGKAALDQWVRNAGAEQRARGGVRISAIAPGVVDTGMQNKIRETSESDFAEVSRFRDLHEGGHLADPEMAATRVWAVIESGIESGTVTDIRRL